MKILYYDCYSGISGDMNLGALVDLGVDGNFLIRELSKLGLDSEYRIEIRRDCRKGISGTKVDVLLTQERHAHDDHGHEGHGHRHLKDIAAIVEGSGLSDPVKRLSMRMFRKVAEAEAKVHGLPVEEVHFHEVGAVDSIVDVVGAAICLDFLKADRILASPVQVGGGFVRCAHGLIPVPAPAVIEILKGVPIKSGLVPFETATPTGAAILAANVSEFTDRMDFSVDRIGYGLGSRDLEIPNALRVFLGEGRADGRGGQREIQYLLETNIDDMNPELYGYVEERLFACGALDVFKTPIIMKKGRPAVKLSVLADAAREAEVSEVLFEETTSIGLRRIGVEKRMLDRRILRVATKYGEVTVKQSYLNGEPVKHKAEYEDCRRIAEQNRIPIQQVYDEVERSLRDASAPVPAGE